ncbi:MAG: LamG-like jellyroll fold domain-containing protein [Planctomycetota bacterium]
MTKARRPSVLGWIALVLSTQAAAHQGPDPVFHWAFSPRTVSAGVAAARLGPDLNLPSTARVIADAGGYCLDLTGDGSERAEARLSEERAEGLPSEAMTVSVWVAIDEAESHGGLVALADADAEADDGGPTWKLGYNDSCFTFAVTDAAEATTTRLVGQTPYEKGQWRHVVGVWDGARIDLYIDGVLDASVDTAVAEIARPAAPVLLVGSGGRAGSASLRGRLREATVYDIAAKPAWVRHAYGHLKHTVNAVRPPRGDDLAMLVEPYLQHGTTDGMTVMWETTARGTSVVRYGETEACEQSATGDDATIHEVRISGLEPATQYFYRAETVDASARKIESRVSTFSTAVEPGTPFAFAVISDTQFNPEVAVRLSRHAWAQRPSFLLHPGDLVDTGVNDTHWTQHFFPGMKPLISRVPMFPVLGNHEQNAQNYFDYMSLPEPEYYYEFRYGDAHFFMLDSNRNVGPDSEQHRWLDRALADSDATWKFVCHHHPPYSSDENDYGDLWRTNKSDRGDLRTRRLSKLYEKHGVDMVWTGHIHSYERTWPIRDGRAVGESDGPVYMIVGGGGGSLETPGPYRPFFQNQVRRCHHYVMAHVNAGTLELRSYDLDDRLFDTVTLRKK